MEAFTAYDRTNRSNVVEAYSLLEPDACANSGRDGEVETTVFGEIVQIKQDRMIPVLGCIVIETLVAQYCGMFSAAGVTRYLKFRELKPLEAWECRKARRTGQLLINGRTVAGKMGATVSHTMVLSGNLDDSSNCEVGMVTLRDGKVLGGMAFQGLYEVTLREEFARMNELTGSLTLTSGVQARAADKSISDSLEGTVAWEYDPMECPQTIVRLYKGMMKAYVNQSSTYEESMVVVEHQDKDQAAGLEVAESFILCSHQAFRTHIKNIAVFVHKDDWMEVAQGRFSSKEGEMDLTRLESGMSFMQVRASMSMKEKLRQVRDLREPAGHRPHQAGGYRRRGQSLQPHLHLRAGPPRHQGRRGNIRDKVLPGGGGAQDAPQLHRGDSRHLQRHRRLRGPHQLRAQERGVTYKLQ